METALKVNALRLVRLITGSVPSPFERLKTLNHYYLHKSPCDSAKSIRMVAQNERTVNAKVLLHLSARREGHARR